MSVPMQIDHVENRIFLIRGHRVMLDLDIAELYQVPTKRINEQVRRNRGRFPSDFMFQLTQREATDCARSRSQNATLNEGRRGSNIKYLPYAFTEQGVAMLSGVLTSPRAIQVNVAIMRAFVKLRQMMSLHQDLMKKIKRMESKYDEKFRVVFVAIKKLMTPPRRKRIDFTVV